MFMSIVAIRSVYAISERIRVRKELTVELARIGGIKHNLLKSDLLSELWLGLYRRPCQISSWKGEARLSFIPRLRI